MRKTLLQHCITIIVILWTVCAHFYVSSSYIWNRNSERKLETVFVTLSCCPTNSRALAYDSIYRLHLCRVLYLSELLVLLMQPKPHSDRFCLTSFTAAVVESAGQQVLNTQPGSGDAFHSYSAFCWLQLCCFRRGDDIIQYNERPEQGTVCASLEIALRPGSQLSLRQKMMATGRNLRFIVSYFSLRMFFCLYAAQMTS